MVRDSKLNIANDGAHHTDQYIYKTPIISFEVCHQDPTLAYSHL